MPGGGGGKGPSGKDLAMSGESSVDRPKYARIDRTQKKRKICSGEKRKIRRRKIRGRRNRDRIQNGVSCRENGALSGARKKRPSQKSRPATGNQIVRDVDDARGLMAVRRRKKQKE